MCLGDSRSALHMYVLGMHVVNKLCEARIVFHPSIYVPWRCNSSYKDVEAVNTFVSDCNASWSLEAGTK